MNQLTLAVEGPFLVVAVVAARGDHVGVVVREVAVAVHVQAFTVPSIDYGASFEGRAAGRSSRQLAEEPVHDALQSAAGVVHLAPVVVPRAVQCQPAVPRDVPVLPRVGPEEVDVAP